MRAPQDIAHLSPAAAAEQLRSGNVTLIDVREPAEFAALHIPGAILRPLSSFDPASLPAGQVIFTCGSGKRSLTAIALCAQAGLAHHAHIAGGLQAWAMAGLPVQRG